MSRRRSSLSSSSSDESDSSLSDASPSLSAPRSINKRQVPLRDDGPEGSSSSSTDDATEDSLTPDEAAYADERAKRRTRQAARSARSFRGSAGRSRSRVTEKPVTVMRSLGLNKTTMRKLLRPHDSQDSSSGETHLVPKKSSPVDPEAQSRKPSTLITATSVRRKLYIGAVAVCLLVLIAIAIVLGFVYDKRTRENAIAEQDEAQRVADEAALDAQGAAMQVSLGMVLGEGNAFATTMTGSSTAEVAVASPTGALQRFPELEALMQGNRNWQNATAALNSTVFAAWSESQSPKLAYVGCSDSRVPETTIFGTSPGEIFATRNVGNQYLIDDLSSETVLSYAVAHLAVQHIVVMGHTNCGAVKAAIISSSDEVLTNMDETRIDTWIRPIRFLFATSTRTEISSFREQYQDQTISSENVTSEVWRALVEENVKLNVQRVAVDPTVQKSWNVWRSSGNASSVNASLSTISASGESHRLARRAADPTSVELWVHGWVYDIATGLVEDLGVSVGPS